MGCEQSNEPAMTGNPLANKNKGSDLSNLTPEQLANMTDEEIAAIEMGSTAFFQAIKAVDTNRDYSIIVDASGSMIGPLWKDAEEAVKHIAPHACKCDENGVSLYFFSSGFNKYDNVKTAEEVANHFKNPKNQLWSSTNLAGVLADAVKPDTAAKPETIIVITDGCPDSKEQVENCIIQATKIMKKDEDLSITIVQIGTSESASQWLEELDDGLVRKGAKYDIVDVLSFAKLKSTNFSEIIRLSVQD